MIVTSIIPAMYYSPVYHTMIFLVCIITCLVLINSTGQETLYRDRSNILGSLIFTIFIIYFIGSRPISGKYFTDMSMYDHVYRNMLHGYTTPSESDEWMWDNIMYFSKDIGLSNTDFFIYAAAIYIGLMAFTCIKLTRYNSWISILFCFSSFSFFSYGVNGICNGIACSFTMLGLAYYLTEKGWKKWIVVPLFFLAYNSHHATALPIIGSIVALMIWKKPSYAIAIWLLSIPISLVAGNKLTSLIANMGFDTRMAVYANLEKEIQEEFTGYNEARQMGFRIDFLLYSAMPILMLWYTTVKRNFQDRTYNIIAITYTLANAFWVIVIRSVQSNRFAYLSWFLYPIVIAYPLLRFRMWERQDRRLAIILTLYAGFTGFMYFFYYR